MGTMQAVSTVGGCLYFIVEVCHQVLRFVCIYLRHKGCDKPWCQQGGARQ